MNSLKLNTHIGEDGLLQVKLPVQNQDLEIMVVYQEIPKKNHSEMKVRFEKIRQQFGNQIFSDSVELLREDRQGE